MRNVAISTPLKPAERHFLRLLDQRDGELLMARGLSEKLAGAALVHAGYAQRCGVIPHRYQITPTGERYLHQLARAY